MICMWFVASSGFVLGQTGHLASANAQFRWPASPADLPAANRTSSSKIAAFVRSLLSEDSSLGVPEFRFVQLEKNRLYLAVSIGRHALGSLVVIKPEGQSFRYFEFEDDEPQPLARKVVDLDGEGVAEVTTAPLVAGYEGATTQPIYWYSIYKFEDGYPRDVSANFPSFYELALFPWLSYLEGLFSQCKVTSPGGSEYALAKIEFVRFKYQRTIKGVKNAGLEQALAWAESSNPNVQMLALRTFEEIADPKSVAEIVKLTHSPKPGVCMTAVNSLAHILHRTPATKDILGCESKQP